MTGHAVCVLGMHRSGTSLAMRALNLLGVALGDSSTLLPADPVDNPAGYWEQQAIIDINNELLLAMGGPSWAPPELRPGWSRAAELEPQRERARRLLDDQFGRLPLWGFKDPRTSLTLEFWRELVPDMSFVVCLRRAEEVVASLLARDPDGPLSAEYWARLWVRYTVDALEQTRDTPRTIVVYEDWFIDAARQVEVLAKHLGLERAPQEALAAVTAYVDPSLWRQREPDPAIAAQVPPAACELYDSIRASISSSTRAADRSGLSRSVSSTRSGCSGGS